MRSGSYYKYVAIEKCNLQQQRLSHKEEQLRLKSSQAMYSTDRGCRQNIGSRPLVTDGANTHGVTPKIADVV